MFECQNEKHRKVNLCRLKSTFFEVLSTYILIIDKIIVILVFANKI